MIIDEKVSELDKELCIEVSKPNLNKEAIDKLIQKGANINVVVYGGDSLLMQLINPDDDKDRINNYYETIKYLIEKGVDINYIHPDYGFNCLFQAELSFKPEIFELLVNSGIYLNNISFEAPKSIFDNIYSDLAVFTGSPHYSEEDIENLDKILWIIEDHNAKSYDELYTNKVKEFLIAGDFLEYGLITYDGNIKIENITNDNDLIENFNKWVFGDYSPWSLCRKLKNQEITIEEFEKHLMNGIEYCNKIKSYIEKDIKFTLYSIDINNYKKENIWDLKAYEI